MDNRPIAFFDSGVGGLTSIPYLMKRLPEEKIIYFGDTARTPYGSKAVETIRRFSFEIVDFLVKSDAKMIVVVCNTISATCIDDLQKRFPDIPVIGIIEPAAMEVARTCTPENRIGVIGTKVTIGSHAYKTLVPKYNEALTIHEMACPAIVPLIEEDIIDHDIMDLTIQFYMDEFVDSNDLDTVILGCTHYTLIRNHIARLYPDLNIINPSSIVVNRIAEVLEERDMFAKGSDLNNVFYASDLSENYLRMIDHTFENKEDQEKIQFLKFDLEDIL